MKVIPLWGLCIQLFGLFCNPNLITRQSTYQHLPLANTDTLLRSSMSSSPGPSKPKSMKKWLKHLVKRNPDRPLPSSSSQTRESASERPHPSNLAENLKISGRFSLSILPKIPGCFDQNPAKMAFNILNLIMEVRKQINDNKDELQKIIEETLLLLSTVLARMETGSDPESIVGQTVEQYKREIDRELERIKDLNDRLHASVFTQVDYEHYKVQLTDISRKIGGSTVRFNTAMAGTTGIAVNEIRDTVRNDKQEKKLRDDLQPSMMADHRYIHEGKSALKREICTEGTRVKILNEITEWANDSSEDSPPVFWLTGQAGAGKTTIAYTITKWFWTRQQTMLGANFFCSRQFGETQSLQRLVPTIAYQLAHRCEPYRVALIGVNTSDAVYSHNVQEQTEKFLFQPWIEQKRLHNQPTYLVVVDALDEIEDTKRSSFLSDLLRSFEKENITGLKFLITSRPDPDIANLCKTFPPGAVCKLQDVPVEEAKQDIAIYLDVKLKHLSGTTEFSMLKEHSAGLFIYAATVVKILTGRKLADSEQLKRLRALLSSASSDFGSIDQLYRQIMCEAFSDLDDDPEILSARLSILYTFLCAAERISTSVTASFLDTDINIVRIVLENLHPVLYVQDSKIYWYHASFPDFIFSHGRSNFHMDGKDFVFSCDAAGQHSLLTHACFRIMTCRDNGLRFNMGNIKSAYLLDREHAEELRKNVDENISPVLRYACFHWAHHLPFVAGGSNSILRDFISNFLEISVLFWIEAMNLLGRSGNCSYLLQDAGSWASKNKEFALAKDLQDTANFATYFSGCPATDSTPHLYLSSLATWQSMSHLCQSWKHRFPRIPLYQHTEGTLDIPVMMKRVNQHPQAIVFSGNGTRIVAALEHSVLFLDAATGRQQHTLAIPYCRLVKISADETRLVVISQSMEDDDNIDVRVYNTSTFQLLRRFSALQAIVSIEETHILSIIKENPRQLEILEISTVSRMRVVRTEALTENAMRLSTFSSVSNRILVAYKQSTELWDISAECAAKACTLDDTGGFGKRIRMSPDGRLVAIYSDGFPIRVQDASTGNIVLLISHKKMVICDLNFSYDASRIILGSQDGTVSVWDISTGTNLKEFVHDLAGGVVSLAFSLDGSRIASASTNHSLCVWSADISAVTQTAQCEARQRNPRFITVAISDDSKKIMSSDWGKVQVWDATTGTELLAIADANIVKSTLCGDGEIIISSIYSGHVKVWNAATGDEILCLNPSEGLIRGDCRSIALSGKKFAFVDGFRPITKPNEYVPTVQIWDMEKGKEMELVLVEGIHAIDCFLSFSDNEEFILVGSMIHEVTVVDNMGNGGSDDYSDESDFNTWIFVWDVQTGNIIHKLKSKIGVAEGLISSNGKEVAVCSTNMIPGMDTKLCEVWDISSGKRLRMMKTSYSAQSGSGEEQEQFRLDSFSLSKDGKKIVVACSDGLIRIWSDVSNENGVAHVTIVGRSLRRMLCSIVFSKDNKRVVTGSRDGSVQVWDIEPVTDEYEWTLQENGWITSTRNEQHRLMWVSEALEVRQPHNTLIVGDSGHGSVDFTRAMIGEDWGKCFSPLANQ